ncbi:MAG: hypothetical protein AAFR64_14740 [Pseudomonadota bacterium]
MKLPAFLALSMLVAGCGVLQPQSLEERLADAVVEFNESEAASVANGATRTRREARLDGDDTLVIAITNLPTGNSTFDPMAMERSLRPEFCDDAEMRELIEAGIRVRFELTSNFGKELPSVQFNRC